MILRSAGSSTRVVTIVLPPLLRYVHWFSSHIGFIISTARRFPLTFLPPTLSCFQLQHYRAAKGTLCVTCKNFLGTERSSSFSPSMSLPSKRVLGLLDMISFPTPCFLPRANDTRGAGRKIQQCAIGRCFKDNTRHRDYSDYVQSAGSLRVSRLVGSVRAMKFNFCLARRLIDMPDRTPPRTCTRR